jgi:aminotransferase
VQVQAPQIADVMSDVRRALSIKYNTMVYELQRSGERVVVLSLGEAFFDIPLYPMDDLPVNSINHYSHSRGLPDLRSRLSDYFATQYDAGFDPEREIVITAGSKIAIYMALLAVLNRGDEVVFQEPAWVSYSEQVRMCGAVPAGIPYDAELREYPRYLTPRTRVLVINNPHNPRGYVYTRDELVELLRLARDRNLWLFSDEAYSDFAQPGAFISIGALDREKRNSVIFNSMSKNYGISGWRVGYAIGNASIVDEILKINEHLVTCPATILEYYLARHFTDLLDITKPQISALLGKREQLAAYMDKIGLSRLRGDATFYFFVSIAPSKLTSEQFCTRLLQEDRVSVVPGIGYGQSCDAFVRVSIGTASLNDVMLGLQKIRALIEKTS